jgi:hypothetical protein
MCRRPQHRLEPDRVEGLFAVNLLPGEVQELRSFAAAGGLDRLVSFFLLSAS